MDEARGRWDIVPVTADNLAELEPLFAGHAVANGCWCMWFIDSVSDYHRAGPAGNKAKLQSLAAATDLPVGVIARQDGGVVGWAATGPRGRYARAVRTPTVKSVDRSENADVWLVPCFFVRPDARGEGLARRLLAACVDLAAGAGARAIEGFPLARPAGTADRQVGTEALFAACGFRPVARPSSNRVLMRRDLPT